MIVDWLLGGTLATALLRFLKGLVSDWLSYWVNAWEMFQRRPYDLDRNKDTKDFCYLQGLNSDTWDVVGLTYHLGWNKYENGVFVHRFTDDWKQVGRERIPFDNWGKRNKMQMEAQPDFNKPKSWYLRF